jgi:penicillin-binding protein 2
VRKNKDIDWAARDHALFVGYAPVDNPRFAVAVVVEHGGSGSSAAAPIARDVLQEVQRLGLTILTSDVNDADNVARQNASDTGGGVATGSGNG